MNDSIIQVVAKSTWTRIVNHSWIMLVVFIVSLFAVSFPTLSTSKRSSIPRILFFVGKHFGTGVILSTAFVHLLQDAFASLHDKEVRKISKVGDWTGLIVLGSLLTIFCVEYVSTAYVSHLNPESPCEEDHAHGFDVEAEAAPSNGSALHHKHSVSEHSPLISPHTHTVTYGRSADPHQSEIFDGHHRFESRIAHAFHHRFSRKLSGWFFTPEESNRHVKLVPETEPEEPSVVVDEEAVADDSLEPEAEAVQPEISVAESTQSKKRQIVGILVLQMGIMIHSLVIGLTISITSGSEFTSLVTAITFHQLFEGLSLGTRIAGLPSSSRSLQSVLAVSFAFTVPVGILIGLCTLSGNHEEAKMKLIQGLMAAISAGMLIYAACVEMLAGDFIMDPTLWKSGIGKQFVAVSSLIVGAGAMAVVGLWS